MTELTILIPARNEEDSIASCVRDAKQFLKIYEISGEVIVVDNNSTDRTKERAVMEGARVYTCLERGYGSAIRFGIKKAEGIYTIIGDGDGSYDFSDLSEFLKMLRSGSDVVIGNRLNQKMQFGALSDLHRFGVIFLSELGRKRSGVKVKDFHCGLRGGRTSILRKMHLSTTGFEFASEFIMKAAPYKISEVDIRYRKTRRIQDKSKLNPILDGIRHLVYILTFKQPKLYPFK